MLLIQLTEISEPMWTVLQVMIPTIEAGALQVNSLSQSHSCPDGIDSYRLCPSCLGMLCCANLCATRKWTLIPRGELRLALLNEGPHIDSKSVEGLDKLVHLLVYC